MRSRTTRHGKRFSGTLLGAEIARSTSPPPLVHERSRNGSAPLSLLFAWWRVAAVVGLVALGLFALARR